VVETQKYTGDKEEQCLRESPLENLAQKGRKENRIWALEGKVEQGREGWMKEGKKGKAGMEES
jgi:hypothetical protein